MYPGRQNMSGKYKCTKRIQMNLQSISNFLQMLLKPSDSININIVLVLSMSEICFWLWVLFFFFALLLLLLLLLSLLFVITIEFIRSGCWCPFCCSTKLKLYCIGNTTLSKLCKKNHTHLNMTSISRRWWCSLNITKNAVTGSRKILLETVTS